jgi:hypothetical protein
LTIEAVIVQATIGFDRMRGGRDLVGGLVITILWFCCTG